MFLWLNDLLWNFQMNEEYTNLLDWKILSWVLSVSFRIYDLLDAELQKQPSKNVLVKSCPENMQQIYRRKPIPLCHGCSPINLLHIFGTAFPKNTTGGLSLEFARRSLLLAHCWLLFTRYLLLSARYWQFSARCLLFSSRCTLLVTFFLLLAHDSLTFFT